MPFQVIFTSQEVPLGTINSFSAGEDQDSTCNTGTILTATINGDTTGHVFLWEQISGPPSTLVPPTDELSVVVTYTTSEDRQYRFWIDKGTPAQRFDDIWIYGTPTSKTAAPVIKAIETTEYGPSCRQLPCAEFGIIPTFPPTMADSFAICSGEPYTLIWNPVDCEQDKFVQYIIQYNTGSGWINEAVINDIDTRTYPATGGRWYRVVTVYNELAPKGTFLTTNVTCKKVTPISGGGVHVWENAVAPVTEAKSDLLNFDIDIKVLKVCGTTYISDLSSGAANPIFGDMTNFTIIERSLKVCPTTYISDLSSGPANPIFGDITNFNIIDLTGGAIGG